jgi:hypothetical protein
MFIDGEQWRLRITVEGNAWPELQGAEKKSILTGEKYQYKDCRSEGSCVRLLRE